MTNSQFIAALKKALAGLDKTSRNDIVEEIKSHALESGSPLIDQFGSVDDLAKQYLEGVKTAKPVSAKIWGFSKNVLVGVGILVISLIALGALFSSYFTKDKFNYADENAAELISPQQPWQNHLVGSDLTIKVDQASVIFYWHDAATVRSSCQGNDLEKQADASLLIRQTHCLIYLPKEMTHINADQAQIVLVKPQANVDITSHQASLKIAENGQSYQYDLDMQRAKFSDLESNDDAKITIKIKAVESMISAYRH